MIEWMQIAGVLVVTAGGWVFAWIVDRRETTAHKLTRKMLTGEIATQFGRIERLNSEARSRQAEWDAVREGLIDVLAVHGMYQRHALKKQSMFALLDMAERSFINAKNELGRRTTQKHNLGLLCDEIDKLKAQREVILAELSRWVDNYHGDPGMLLDGIRVVVATIHNHKRQNEEITP